MNKVEIANGSSVIVAPKPAIIIATTMPGEAPKPIPEEFTRYNVPIIGQPANGN